MKYKEQAVEIISEAELEAARAAGALIEFTACADWELDPDTLDMPSNEGGFCEVLPEEDARISEILRAPLPGDMARAFYPEEKE